jgi:hypothetical protein
MHGSLGRCAGEGDVRWPGAEHRPASPISDAAERIWDTLENDKEVVEALESTNESVL